MNQAQLADLTGLKQATVSSLEHDRITMGVERSKILARAIKVNPAFLAFADWEISEAA